jgi:hypothetical protein
MFDSPTLGPLSFQHLKLSKNPGVGSILVPLKYQPVALAQGHRSPFVWLMQLETTPYSGKQRSPIKHQDECPESWCK